MLASGGTFGVGAVSGPNGEDPRGALRWDLPGYSGTARVTCVNVFAIPDNVSEGRVIGEVQTPDSPAPYVFFRVFDTGESPPVQTVAIEPWFAPTPCAIPAQPPGDLVTNGNVMIRDD
jgi:hypothetical protein